MDEVGKGGFSPEAKGPMRSTAPMREKLADPQGAVAIFQPATLKTEGGYVSYDQHMVRPRSGAETAKWLIDMNPRTHTAPPPMPAVEDAHVFLVQSRSRGAHIRNAVRRACRRAVGPAGVQVCKQLGGWACQHAGVPSKSAVFTAIDSPAHDAPSRWRPHVYVPVCACGALRM